MNGREDWAKFASEYGLTWEEGPPASWDQYGREYLTLIWSLGDTRNLERVLRGDKHVIVRMFPHSATNAELQSLVRMRFTSYTQKPVEAVK